MAISGAEGRQGDPGNIVAFTAKVGSASIINNKVTVISKTVPAGTYAINAKMAATTVDDDPAQIKCWLRVGGVEVDQSDFQPLEENSWASRCRPPRRASPAV